MGAPFLVPANFDAGTSGATIISPNSDTPNPFDPTSFTWTEVIASTAQDWGGFYISGMGNSRLIVQVAVGAASAETIVATIPVGLSLSGTSFNWFVPVAIAAGSRVSVASHYYTVTDHPVQVVGVPAANMPGGTSFSVMEAGPFNFDDYLSLYAEVDPGAVANTKGAYTEISFTGGVNNANNVLNGDSLTQDYSYFGFIVGDAQTFQTDQFRLWDFATGPASSEVAFAENIFENMTAGERNNFAGNGFMFPWDVAAGARISARMQSSITDATDRVGSVCLIGLR